MWHTAPASSHLMWTSELCWWNILHQLYSHATVVLEAPWGAECSTTTHNTHSIIENILHHSRKLIPADLSHEICIAKLPGWMLSHLTRGQHKFPPEDSSSQWSTIASIKCWLQGNFFLPFASVCHCCCLLEIDYQISERFSTFWTIYQWIDRDRL